MIEKIDWDEIEDCYGMPRPVVLRDWAKEQIEARDERIAELEARNDSLAEALSTYEPANPYDGE